MPKLAACYVRKNGARAALTGILFAMAGFSYAMATQSRGMQGAASPGDGAASRAVASNLHFTNPTVKGGKDFDLGDAVIGSLFTTRFCNAAGGSPPYTFTSPAGSMQLAVVAPSLALLADGELLAPAAAGSSGILSGNLSNPLRFTVQVTDSLGSAPNVATGTFRITLVSGTQFKFGNSTLSNGAIGRSYADRMIVLNGNTTAKTGIVFSVDTVSGPGGDTLEHNGLTLSASEGLIYGKPFIPGAITFVAHATDANQTKALSRDGTQEGQPLTINIEAGSLNSDIASTAITITGDSSGGRDKISYAGFANMRGLPVSAFSGKVLTLRIANYVSPNATFDAKGHATNSSTSPGSLGRGKGRGRGRGRAVASGNLGSPKISATLGRNGQLKIQVSSEFFGALIPHLLPPPTPVVFGNTEPARATTIPIGVSIFITDPSPSNPSILNSEMLRFTTGRENPKGIRFSLAYKLGEDKNGNVNSLGGNFLLTSVVSKDASIKAARGDAWKVGFIASPSFTPLNPAVFPTGHASVQSGTASVSIGMFTDAIPVVLSNRKSGKRVTQDPLTLKFRPLTPRDPDVLHMNMSDVTSKGSFTTGILPSDSTTTPPGTGIPLAKGGPASFPFAVDITFLNTAGDGTQKIFSMDDSIVIFSRGGSWSDKIPNK